MSAADQLRARKVATPMPRGGQPQLAQRRCPCGGVTGADGECEACRARRLSGQPRAGAQPASARHASAHAGGGHSFGQLQVAPPPGPASGGHRARSAGAMRVQITQSSSPGGRRTGTMPGDEANLEEPHTLMSASTSGNRIDFTFDPTTSAPKPQCDEIVIIQSIQMNADGAPIKPGSWYSPWTCRDAVALNDTTYIDHDCACVTPYYTYCFNGTPGASNGVTTNATAIDAPNATGGGDKGFKSPSNPTGWTNLTWNFETYAFCAAGTDCGTWYDGVQWNYTKTDVDNSAGRNGTSTATASLAPPGASSTVVRAFNRFNSVKGFVPCTVSVIPRLPTP